MKTKQYFRGLLSGALIALLGAGVVACSDPIQINERVDESIYDDITVLQGQLLDADTKKSEQVIELLASEQTVDVEFSLTHTPNKGVDVVVEYAADYASKFNEGRTRSYELFPSANVDIEYDGKLLLAPDEKFSVPVTITITKPMSPELTEGQTYIIPLKVTSQTEGVTLNEESSYMTYMVKPIYSQGSNDTFKGDGAVRNILYFEVNDVNPLNALEMVLEDGSLFFDEIILFSSNVNYNAEEGRVYILHNPNVQFLLDNNEQFLQPLRKRGMKVILSLLGNHDPAGVAQLSTVGSQMLAKEIAETVYAYNLDGVAYDDEYSQSPDLSSPLFAPKTGAAASRLIYETKKLMPEKISMVYYLGAIYSSTLIDVDGISPHQYVDYAVADYGGAAAPVKGATIANCAGMSIELNLNRGNSSESYARSQKDQGYGYYMFFALNPSQYSTQIPRCQNVARGLYDRELLTPTHYYPKNSTVRTPL